MTTQLGFEQSSSHQRRPSWPTRLRYLPRSAFDTPCYCPLTPFGGRSGAALTTSLPVGCTLATSVNAPQWRTPTCYTSPFLSEFKPTGRDQLGMHRIFQQSWYLSIHSLSAAYAAHYLVAHPVGSSDNLMNTACCEFSESFAEVRW